MLNEVPVLAKYLGYGIWHVVVEQETHRKACLSRLRQLLLMLHGGFDILLGEKRIFVNDSFW